MDYKLGCAQYLMVEKNIIITPGITLYRPKVVLSGIIPL